MFWLLALAAWALAEAITVVGPAYPPNAVSGGTVTALLHVSAGEIRGMDILQGDAPFVAPTRSALGAWRFRSSDSGDYLVVVNFRSPTLYATGPAGRKISARPDSAEVPGIKSIVEPVYPANSLGEGSAVFRLGILASGAVSNAVVVQGLGDLTSACLAAVRQWQFVPAATAGKNPGSSEVYAVCVLRRPVLGKSVP